MKGISGFYRHQWQVLLVCLFLLLGTMLLSLMFGATSVSIQTIIDSFTHFDATNQAHQVIQTVRLPRILGAAFVGASLAVSGALAQGITQNPLADSGLLGINAGAGLGLALVFAFLPQASYWWLLVVSFLGAGVSVALIYYLSNHSIRGASPMRLTLVGAGISALFLSFSQFLAIQFNLSQELTFWFLGGVSVISWAQLKIVVPIFLGAFALAILISPSVTILRFGDDATIGLGRNPQRIRFFASITILLLSGLSVALVGSVSFVGLVVPHVMRTVSGENYHRLIPFSALGGALLVLVADLIARMVNPPFETPFGIITALIGIPFFLYLFRKGGQLG